MPKYTCAVFDLDGTVLDTLDDLTAAVNHAMDFAGHPRHDRMTVRRMVGNGVKVLIDRALGENAPEALAESALSEFKRYYADHLDVHTREYAGITPMLKSLKAQGVTLCLCSNKFNSAVQTLISAHFPDLFDVFVGEGDGIPKKPAPQGTWHVMKCVNADPAKTCYIGDSAVDFQTAKNAGLPCISVSWGFADRDALEALAPDALCDTTDQLFHAIIGD